MYISTTSATWKEVNYAHICTLHRHTYTPTHPHAQARKTHACMHAQTQHTQIHITAPKILFTFAELTSLFFILVIRICSLHSTGCSVRTRHGAELHLPRAKRTGERRVAACFHQMPHSKCTVYQVVAKRGKKKKQEK